MLGQVTISVQTEKGRKEFAENEPILVNVILQVKGKDLHQQTPLRLFSTSKFEVLGQGSEQSSFYDEKTGILVNQIHYQTLLRAKKSGKYKIGSASVEVNDKLYYTEPFDIQVYEGGAYAENKNDLSLKLTVDNRSPYQNEKVVAVVTAYSKNIDALKKIRKISLPHHPKIKVLHSDFSKEIVEKNDDIHSQVVAVFTLSPEASGWVKIPSIQGEMNTNSAKLVSNSIQLQVKDIPIAEKKKSEVVGNYEINIRADEKKPSIVGQPYSVFVTIEGEGNLVERHLPTLKKSAHYQVFPPKVTQNKTNKGTAHILEYIILPKKAGTLQVKTESFVFFNPITESYEEIAPKLVVLDSILPEEDTSSDVVEHDSKDTLPSNNQLSKGEKKDSYNFFQQIRPYLQYGFPVVLLVGVFLILRKKKHHKKKHLSAAERDASSDISKRVMVYLDEMFLSVTERDFDNYFAVYHKLSMYMEKIFWANDDEGVLGAIENQCGRNISERYKEIHQKIRLEKFAPHHDTEHFYELTQELKTIMQSIIAEI